MHQATWAMLSVQCASSPTSWLPDRQAAMSHCAQRAQREAGPGAQVNLRPGRMPARYHDVGLHAHAEHAQREAGPGAQVASTGTQRGVSQHRS